MFWGNETRNHLWDEFELQVKNRPKTPSNK